MKIMIARLIFMMFPSYYPTFMKNLRIVVIVFITIVSPIVTIFTEIMMINCQINLFIIVYFNPIKIICFIIIICFIVNYYFLYINFAFIYQYLSIILILILFSTTIMIDLSLISFIIVLTTYLIIFSHHLIFKVQPFTQPFFIAY